MTTASMVSAAVARRSGVPQALDVSFFEQVFRARGSTPEENSMSSAATGRPSGEIGVAVATTREMLLEAAELVRERYEWRGYVTRSITVDADSMRPSTTLVAVQDSRVVGTMTLGYDGPSGLWIDHTYPDEISQARADGRTLIELTRLAVTPNSDSRKILSSMFALAYRVGRVAHGATDLYIEVNPRHAPVYRKLFGFTAVSEVRLCGRVKAPAVLLRMDIERLDEQFAKYLGTRAADFSGLGHPEATEVYPTRDRYAVAA